MTREIYLLVTRVTWQVRTVKVQTHVSCTFRDTARLCRAAFALGVLKKLIRNFHAGRDSSAKIWKVNRIIGFDYCICAIYLVWMNVEKQILKVKGSLRGQKRGLYLDPATVGSRVVSCPRPSGGDCNHVTL